MNPRRIALIKPSALGDIVHTLPVLSALRRRWPGASITWIVNQAYAPLIADHPDLDDVLIFDRHALRRGPAAAALAGLRFLRRIRQARFDLAIDMQGLLRTGIMAGLSGAGRRVGFANAREGATRFYTDAIAIPDADEIHAVDRYWRLVEALGAGDAPKRFLVPLSDKAQRQADVHLRELPRPIVVMAIGARWATKRWPIESFATLANDCFTKYGGSAVYVGGQEDRLLAQRAMSWGRVPSINLCGETSLPVLAAVLKAADVVVANDSGPLHLAAALGRPVVAPYTCTLIRQHGPYGQFGRAVAADIACHGSYLRNCSHMSCLPTLPPRRIAARLDEVLAACPVRQSA